MSQELLLSFFSTILKFHLHYFKIAAGGWEQEERLEAWLVDIGEAAYYPVNKEKT